MIYRGEDTNHSEHCRLCETKTETRRLVRIFSAAGSKKDWQTKISTTCGVIIAEEDYLPKVICHKCGIFVEKMFEFIQTCKSSQVTLTQHYGMKRGTVTSPPYKQPAKRTCILSESDVCNSRKKLGFCQVKSSSFTPSVTSQCTTQININVENASVPSQVQYNTSRSRPLYQGAH